MAVQLTKKYLAAVFPMLAHHLKASNHAVYTYAAVCLERILCMKGDGSAL
jgi:exportin-2 (importin alpha re-exporter)